MSEARDDVDRDAWLTQALRHAPDADDMPPSALREQILRRSRTARRMGHRVRAASALESGWAWLARPSVAAGLAGVAVSVVLTVLWSSGRFDEGHDVAPQAALPPAAPVEATAPTPPSGEVRRDAPAAATRVQPRPPALAKQANEPWLADAARRASAPPAAMRPAEPRSASPSTAPPPASPPVATPSVDPRADVAQEAAAPAASSEAASRGPVAAKAERSRDEARSEAALGLAPRASALPVGPLQSLASLGRARGQAWHWNLAGRPHRHGADQQAWLEQLLAATAGRWQRADRLDESDAGVLRLQLFEGDSSRGELVVGERQVTWNSPTQGHWRAPLDEAEARDLQARVQRW